jgi:hypothetical protein
VQDSTGKMSEYERFWHDFERTAPPLELPPTCPNCGCCPSCGRFMPGQGPFRPTFKGPAVAVPSIVSRY